MPNSAEPKIDTLAGPPAKRPASAVAMSMNKRPQPDARRQHAEQHVVEHVGRDHAERHAVDALAGEVEVVDQLFQVLPGWARMPGNERSEQRVDASGTTAMIGSASRRCAASPPAAPRSGSCPSPQSSVSAGCRRGTPGRGRPRARRGWPAPRRSPAPSRAGRCRAEPAAGREVPRVGRSRRTENTRKISPSTKARWMPRCVGLGQQAEAGRVVVEAATARTAARPPAIRPRPAAGGTASRDRARPRASPGQPADATARPSWSWRPAFRCHPGTCCRRAQRSSTRRSRLREASRAGGPG